MGNVEGEWSLSMRYYQPLKHSPCRCFTRILDPSAWDRLSDSDATGHQPQNIQASSGFPDQITEICFFFFFNACGPGSRVAILMLSSRQSEMLPTPTNQITTGESRCHLAAILSFASVMQDAARLQISRLCGCVQTAKKRRFQLKKERQARIGSWICFCLSSAASWQVFGDEARRGGRWLVAFLFAFWIIRDVRDFIIRKRSEPP